MAKRGCLRGQCVFGVVLVLVMGALPFAESLHAQGTTATVQGRVFDNTEAVIPGASVTATNVQTGAQRTVTTNSAGFYAISNLPPGSYAVQVSAPGFQQAIFSNMTLTVGQQVTLNATLQLGDVSQQIEVVAEAAEISTTSSEVSGVVSPTRVEEMPLLSRDFRDLVSLLPGVVPIPSSYTQAGGSAATRTLRTSIAGGRASASAYYLDGLYLNTWNGYSPSGVTGSQIGIDAVREFRVIVNSYNAEYGRAGSGIINMVSKSGTNSFHGSVFEYFRNDKLNARNFFDIRKPSLRRNQFGFTFGGPIFEDRTFFFVNWEGAREREGLSLVQRVPDLNARRGLLPDGQPLPNAIGTPLATAVMNLYPQPNTNANCGPGCVENVTQFRGQVRDDLGNLRIDQSISSNHSLFARYTVNDGALILPGVSSSFFRTSQSRTQWASLQEDWIVTPTMVNTFRAGLTRRRNAGNTLPSEGVSVSPLLVIPTRAEPAFYTIANYVQLAPGRTSGGGDSDWTFQFSDDLSWVRGSHTFKFGFRADKFEKAIIGDELSSDGRATAYGQWRFLTLASFFAGRPSEIRDSLTATPQANDRINKQTLFGAYFQDEYRVLPNLTLNMGLRIESMSAPERVPVAYNFVNPFFDSGTSPVYGEYV